MLKIDPKNSRLAFTPKSTWKTSFHHHESCFFHIICASYPYQNIKDHQSPSDPSWNYDVSEFYPLNLPASCDTKRRDKTHQLLPIKAHPNMKSKYLLPLYSHHTPMSHYIHIVHLMFHSSSTYIFHR